MEWKWSFVVHNCLKRSLFSIMNDIMNGIMNDKKSSYIVNDIMNFIVNDKKGHNIVNDNFAF